MKTLVRCKVCGYITEQAKVRDVCPACGVSAKAFEPYKDTVSEKRSMILGLHLHPISVHFPQAFATLSPVLLIAGWLFPISFKGELIAVAWVLSYLLPLAVIVSILAGFIDAKVRFKTVKTIILTKKIFIAIVMLIIALIGAVLEFTGGMIDGMIPWLILTNVLCLVCAILLGNLGSSIMESKMPG